MLICLKLIHYNSSKNVSHYKLIHYIELKNLKHLIKSLQLYHSFILQETTFFLLHKYHFYRINKSLIHKTIEICTIPISSLETSKYIGKMKTVQINRVIIFSCPFLYKTLSFVQFLGKLLVF